MIAPHDAREIARSVREQIEHGRYEKSGRFGDGQAGKRIANILAEIEVPIQKRITY